MSSFGFARLGLAEGESVRDVDLLAVEADLEMIGVVEAVAAETFCRACSSAMRWSIAPLILYALVSNGVFEQKNQGICCLLGT